MNTNAVPAWKTIILWILRIAMAALFGFAAFKKISGNAEMVQQFGQVGLGQWFRYFVALFEVAGVIALLLPRSVTYGALALLVVDIGAFIVQLTILHGDIIHTILIGLILGAIIYLRRDREAVAIAQPA